MRVGEGRGGTREHVQMTRELKSGKRMSERRQEGGWVSGKIYAVHREKGSMRRPLPRPLPSIHPASSSFSLWAACFLVKFIKLLPLLYILLLGIIFN